jgi:hypothetical protein
MTRRFLLAMLAALATLRKPKPPLPGTVHLDANGDIAAIFYQGKWHRSKWIPGRWYSTEMERPI